MPSRAVLIVRHEVRVTPSPVLPPVSRSLSGRLMARRGIRVSSQLPCPLSVKRIEETVADPNLKTLLEMAALELRMALDSLQRSIKHGDGLADLDLELQARATACLEAARELNIHLDEVTKGQGLD
jgi:hypothetical protein